MNTVELAKNSFGLLVPADLHEVHPFNLLDLEEDALVRVHSIDEDGTVNVQDSSWTIVRLSPERLGVLEDVLEDKWVKLVPTIDCSVTENVTKLNKEAFEALENAIANPPPANEALVELMKLR